MQIQKELYSGKLYFMCAYSAGALPGQNASHRAQRNRLTSEYKKKINALQRKYHLMRLMNHNFKPGRDLFVYLGWAHEPEEEEWKQALRLFHKRMTRYFTRRGQEYKYILITENHTKDGEPCRRHHHLIIRGLGRRMQGKILEFWGRGSVDVRILRELTDNFEDTCRYLLKEKKEFGKRSFNCSRNLKKPPEPVRRKYRESQRGQVPPGVKTVEYTLKENEFGRYEILVGKIVDEAEFQKYWAKIKADSRLADSLEYWRRRARK